MPLSERWSIITNTGPAVFGISNPQLDIVTPLLWATPKKTRKWTFTHYYKHFAQINRPNVEGALRGTACVKFEPRCRLLLTAREGMSCTGEGNRKGSLVPNLPTALQGISDKIKWNKNWKKHMHLRLLFLLLLVVVVVAAVLLLLHNSTSP